jgi:hypothetical protein
MGAHVDADHPVGLGQARRDPIGEPVAHRAAAGAMDQDHRRAGAHLHIVQLGAVGGGEMVVCPGVGRGGGGVHGARPLFF